MLPAVPSTPSRWVARVISTGHRANTPPEAASIPCGGNETALSVLGSLFHASPCPSFPSDSFPSPPRQRSMPRCWHTWPMIDWPPAEILTTRRLVLEPLSVAHAPAMVEVLRDDTLYVYTGGEAPTLEQLRRRYALQILGPPDLAQVWCNWIVKPKGGDAPVGFVQATLEANVTGLVASIAWLISPSHQNQGLATEATQAMCTWLRSQGVGGFVAYVHPGHGASMAVARGQRLHPTSVVEDSELRWES